MEKPKPSAEKKTKAYGFCPQVGGSCYETLGLGEEVSPTLNKSQMVGVLIKHEENIDGKAFR